MLLAFSGLLEMTGVGLLAGAVALFLSPESSYAEKLFSLFRQYFPGAGQQAFQFTAIAGVSLLLVIKNLLAYFIIALGAKFLRSAQHTISCRMFRNCLEADYRRFISRPTDEYNGVMERINRLFDSWFQPGLQFIADVIVIALLAVMALLLLPWKAIAVLPFMFAGAWGINRIFQKLNRHLGEVRYQDEVRENKLRLNVLLGMEQIRISGAGEHFFDNYRELNANLCRHSAKLYTLGQIPRLSLESIAIIMAAAVFGILLYSGAGRGETLMTFTVIAAAMARVLPALSRAHYSLTQLKQNGVLLDELSSELDFLDHRELPVDPGVKPDCKEDIILENVSFSYTEGKPVIQNLSCRFKARQINGIAGRSGIGKTTLINLLSGFFRPDSGTISAGETDITLNLPAWRKQLGYVPQNVFIFEAGVKENVTMGCGTFDPVRFERALTAAQLPEFIRTPEKILNRTNLSGGQQQRIGIARALYRDPGLLILDEATSALDGKTENAFLEVLESLRGQVTVIVISHRKETLDICDNILSL